MGWPVTTVVKTLLAASSTAIGSISTAAGGTVTLSCVTLDTARRISVFSASLSGPTYTITGLNQYGKQISETIIPSTTVVSVATTTQDFLKVSSVVLSCSLTNSSGGFLIGTSTNGGTPWLPIDTTRNPTNVGFTLLPASSLTQTNFEVTDDYPFYDPISGTWPQCASPTQGPQPTISSLGSSVVGPSATIGSITTPFTAWRITFDSTGSSGTGGTQASVMQLGA
jgi:hypothetical protein